MSYMLFLPAIFLRKSV